MELEEFERAESGARQSEQKSSLPILQANKPRVFASLFSLFSPLPSCTGPPVLHSTPSVADL